MNDKNKSIAGIVGGASLFLILNRLFVDTLTLPWHTTLYGVILTVAAASFMGLREFHLKNNEEFTYVMEWRAAMRPAALSALIYSVFTWIFYSFIDPNFFTVRIAHRKRAIEKAVAEGTIPADESAQIIENFNAMSGFISPLNWATFTLLSILIYSMFIGALLTVITRGYPKLLAK